MYINNILFSFPVSHKRISHAKMSLLTKLIRSFPCSTFVYPPVYPIIFACIVYSVNFVNFVCQSVHAVVSTRFDTFPHTLTRLLYAIYSESILKLRSFQKKKKKSTFYRSFCLNARLTLRVSVFRFYFCAFVLKSFIKKKTLNGKSFSNLLIEKL